MAGHLIILLQIVALVVGTWAVFYIRQLYKMVKHPFLKPLGYNIIFFNLMVLLFGVMKYFNINLLGDDASVHSQSYHIVSVPITGFLFLGLMYSFLGVALRLLGRSISVNIKRLFSAGVMLTVISYAIGITIYIETSSYKWLFTTEACLILLSLLIIFASLVFLICHRGQDPNTIHQKAVHAFGYLYLAGYSFPFLFYCPLKLLAVSIFFFLINFIPFIWFKCFFLKYHTMAFSSFQDQSSLEGIYREYNISKREKEIIGLILQGKSNKEIEKSLFISVHTVKNHVHNLYQKLGVKTRGQLVHFILQAQKRT